MAQFTRQAIIDCTLEMAEQKPLNKITVRNITEACGITRNTFYYYFHDIYNVLEGFIQQKLDQLFQDANIENEEAIFDLIEFTVKYRKLWLNLYRTLGHDRFTRFVIEKIHGAIEKVIRHEAGQKEISSYDLYLLTAFYEEALAGVFVRWLRNSLNDTQGEELSEMVRRIRVLFEGQTKLFISNSAANPQT